MRRPTAIDGGGKGYICLYRKLLEHPLFREKPEGWLKIWLYILLRANWRESVFRPRRGESIVVPAGSLITSLEKMGTHTALSKEHARRALDYMERTQSVTLVRTHHWTMITIVNWGAYQQTNEEGHHAEHHASQHAEFENATHGAPRQTPRTATPSKEEKNLDKKYMSNSDELDSPPANAASRRKLRPSKEGAIDAELLRWFEGEFWPLYPRHEGKQPALKAAAAKATTPEIRATFLERLKSQLPAYLERKAESGQRVIPMAATWFNQGRSEDELSSASPQNRRDQRGDPQNDYSEYVPLSRAV